MIERTSGQARQHRRMPTAVAALLFCFPAGASPKPTATEVFHLRSECGRLGKQLLEENSITGIADAHGFSGVTSKYDEETNRCYVLIKDIYLKEGVTQLYLYDGQGGGVIADWSSRSTENGTIKGQTVQPSVAYEYIMQMMKDDVGGK